MCSVQGADACSNVANSRCNEDTEKCMCLPSYMLTSAGTCEMISTDNYITNGQSVSPFVRADVTTFGNEFRPYRAGRGEEPRRRSKRFGIDPNGYSLRAEGVS